MKNSPLTTILLVLVTVSALVSLGSFWGWIRTSRELRDLQTNVNNINGRNAAMNALIPDLLEYSKHNPAIDPILQSVGIKPGAAAPTGSSTNKPPGK